MLIYLSYPIHDYAGRPGWVQRLKDSAPDGWYFFDAWVGFTEQLQDPLFSTALSKRKPNSVGTAHCDILKLEPDLFRPLNDVMSRLISSDQEPTTEHVFRELYVLLRADAVVVDLNTRSHGGGGQAALYAHLLGLPVVGLTERFVLSPWLLSQCSVLLRMSDRDSLFRHIETLLIQKIIKATDLSTSGVKKPKPSSVDSVEKKKPRRRRTRTGSGK